MGFFKELFGMEDTYATDRDDVRGWSVNDKQGGTLGRMDDWLYDDDSRAVRYGVVKTDDRRVLIPAGDLRYDDSRRAVIADALDCIAAVDEAFQLDHAPAQPLRQPA